MAVTRPGKWYRMRTRKPINRLARKNRMVRTAVERASALKAVRSALIESRRGRAFLMEMEGV